MKIISLIFFTIFLLITPVFGFADCSKSGTTVIFVNGMFTFSQNDADMNRKILSKIFEAKSNLKDVNFVTGYNPSHVGGLGDIVNVAVQAYTGGYLDYDLTNILRQAHENINTQKILLVGHSQGTFYTNAAYDYLVSHGVDKKSIAVYNVGTPADRVAGNGGYLTSSTDKVINSIAAELTKAGYAKHPLPANIDLRLSPAEQSSPIGGHSFSEVYLAEAPDKIIGDMDKELNSLSEDTNKDECFIQPKPGAIYWIADEGYKLADDVASSSEAFATSPYSLENLTNVANSIGRYLYGLGQKIGTNIVQLFNNNPAALSITTQSQSTTLNLTDNAQQQVIVENSPAENNLSEYTGIGGPISLTDEQKQDILDDIQEKLDIIKQEIQDLIAAQNQNNLLAGTSGNQEASDMNTQDQDNNPNNDNNNYSNNGGTSKPVYSKVLISEVQLASATDSKQEFVELYNPNNKEVDLTDWYLQRKTATASSWATYASSNLFSGKIISANGYFLIARTGYYAGLADIFTDNAITDDNSFTLKNPNGEISDKLGFGNAIDSELLATVNPAVGQSIGRKFLNDGTEEETNNNFNDFELQTLTPKAQNITYTTPVIRDTTAPAITLNGDAELTISVGSVYTDLGAAATDDTDGNITANIITVNPVNVNIGGDYKITYNVSDVAGNPAVEVDRLVHVVAATKKVLINEIQINPIAQRFVELYNPNSEDINLTGWYLQRKKMGDDSWGSFVTSTNFKDKIIKAEGYFIISRELANSDILSNITLTDNNSLAIKNSSGEIVDKVGYGLATDFETKAADNPASGQSIQRKWDSVSNTYQDTDDNSKDFIVLNNPTPLLTDKTSLISEVSSANDLLINTLVGIEIGNVLQSTHDLFNNAIVTAQAFIDNSNATQTQINNAVLELFAATTVFNGSLITVEDQVAAQTVINQIEFLPHTPTRLSANIYDSGLITDFTLPDFGYNTTPSTCMGLYWCGILKTTKGDYWLTTEGLNNISPHPYNLSTLGIWPADLNGFIDANYSCESGDGKCTWWILPGNMSLDCYKDFKNCTNNAVYYFSFSHSGTNPNTGWSTNSLNLSNNQAVLDAKNAYNNLTPTQQALVTNYSVLQSAENN